MKRTERHHLKDNELATIALNVQRGLETRSKEVLGLLVGLVVVVAGILGYVAWQSRVEARASGGLAAAMATLDMPAGPQDEQNPTPGPRFATERERSEEALSKFKAVADEYGSTEAGVLARYREGSLLTALGRPAEAVAAYRLAIDGGGDTLVGQMARLGLAEAHVQSKEYDQAISVYQELTANTSGMLPVEGVLMQLARAYRSAGRTDDARQTFTRVVEEFTASPYRGEAQRELTLLGESS